MTRPAGMGMSRSPAAMHGRQPVRLQGCDVLFVVLLPIVLVALVVDAPPLALAAVAVAALAGYTTWRNVHDLGATVLAAGIAPVLLVDLDHAIAVTVTLGTVLVAERLRAPGLLALGAAAVLLPGAIAYLVPPVAIALLAAGRPVILSRRPGRLAALPYASWSLAAGVAVVSVTFGTPAWVVGVALTAGLTTHMMSRQPANIRVGNGLAAGALVLSPLPAFGGFLLSALDRAPQAEPVPILLVAWGAVALGGITILVGLGIDTVFQAEGHLERSWLPLVILGFFWTIGLALTGRFEMVLLVIGTTLPLVAGLVAIGARRAGAVVPHPVVAAITVSLLVLLLLPLRIFL